jgi:hypothetical protein
MWLKAGRMGLMTIFMVCLLSYVGLGGVFLLGLNLYFKCVELVVKHRLKNADSVLCAVVGLAIQFAKFLQAIRLLSEEFF